MEEKKNSNLFSKFMFFLFIIFICLYSVNKSGYFEKINKDKVLYTEKQINEFESDVENGKYLDFEKYVETEKKDYSNVFSDFGVTVSSFIDKICAKGIELIKKVFDYLFS